VTDQEDQRMQASRSHRLAVGVATALLAVTVVAGPVQAGPAPWLTATPTASLIPLEPGSTVTVTVTNTDRRTASSALTVTLARNPTAAPFSIGADTCSGLILAPGRSCTIEVRYDGPLPGQDHRAALTVSSGKPAKASVTRTFEVGVSFGQVCQLRGGVAGHGGSITVIGATFQVGDRCDWAAILPTAEYNATFEALSGECFDLGYGGMIGYPTTSETGRTAIGCVVD
jgi:hypothetical protein